MAGKGMPWAKGGDSPFAAPDAKDKAAMMLMHKKKHKATLRSKSKKPTAAEIQQATLMNMLKNKKGK